MSQSGCISISDVKLCHIILTYQINNEQFQRIPEDFFSQHQCYYDRIHESGFGTDLLVFFTEGAMLSSRHVIRLQFDQSRPFQVQSLSLLYRRADIT